jgi:hypothetical protein
MPGRLEVLDRQDNRELSTMKRKPHGRWSASRAAVAAALLSLLTTVALALPALALFQDQPGTQPLVGVFTVTISRDDVPTNLPGGPALAGLWNITFNGDGTYSLARQDVGPLASGVFTAGDATLTFKTWSGLVGCAIAADSDTPVTYAWSQVEDTLTLTPIDDTCAERLTLLTTRSLGGFEPCAVPPRSLSDPFAAAPEDEIPFATPIAPAPPGTGVAAQEGLSEGADAAEAIDNLLRQANGCWATGDPTRFLALHSDEVIQQLAFVGPLDEFTRQLRLFMATPLVMKRIGEVNLIDSDHAWAYVEVTLGGDPIPQRMDFVFENGMWLLDTFFLFGASAPTAPVGVET